jgi:hypothetical protein
MELSDAPEKIPSDRGSIPGPSDSAVVLLNSNFYVIRPYRKSRIPVLVVAAIVFGGELY